MEPPKVKVDIGYTLNVGNYESLKINVGLEDCARIVNGEKESISSAFDRVFAIVEEQLRVKLDEAKQAFK